MYSHTHHETVNISNPTQARSCAVARDTGEHPWKKGGMPRVASRCMRYVASDIMTAAGKRNPNVATTMNAPDATPPCKYRRTSLEVGGGG